MAFDLQTLTLLQLTKRLHELMDTYKILVTERDNCIPGSFSWALQNAALYGCMEDITDTTAEMTRNLKASAEPVHA
jgi:hypothetical protein